MQRCAWCTKDPLYTAYHDEEWGVPVRSPHKLFEMVVLESMQAGLSWLTVLRKREAMRHAFLNFSPEKLARLTDEEIQILLSNDSIIRNRLKIKSVKTNAQSFLRIAEQEDIVDYFWQFTGGEVLQNQRKTLSEIPAITTESTAMAKQLKKDGFIFMGPTTCYAFMQSVGMVNDHLVSCFRHNQLECATAVG
ncbi:DNA-3-methyladenine glycosylase I [Legionella micdadei]|uniref:DNA-3-methyladenine glycosylase 1 n=1 Tax=Legionella micdadei TaxID=451 RepID=A0A098GBP6_LEGMI|nr:DNA-3-methyladenine glycosylase I [Legionella micdadei]ARG96222.1 DNA-3-methyladenine glycosylase I [Legionella micdadei]ARG98977.1 DNA-3-methyladenine glycosylase I [Legionella micdadei]KTD29034.1 3-methyladenine DNA glycosylase [Legionella micdadei]CEG59397.1 DNA-3-methyladenine glycosylase 1 [Legionella micdadei]SCY00472.1 DNA-3-methyladenine glycosylase I [Legionella micdadei]